MNSRSVSFWRRLVAWTVLATTLPLAIQAHPGHSGEASWFAGAFHPLSGWDHALALLGAGLWGIQWGGRARWLFPAVFLAGMAAGVPLATRVVALPGLESFALAALLVMGLALAFAIRASLPAAAAMVGLFALAHGASHGQATGPGVPPMTYVAGFLMGSAAWLFLGMGLGLLERRIHSERWLRWAGAALAVGGLWGLAA